MVANRQKIIERLSDAAVAVLIFDATPSDEGVRLIRNESWLMGGILPIAWPRAIAIIVNMVSLRANI